MKAGAKVRFNMHYHAIGEPVTDRTEVGIVFYPKGVVPKHVITTILAPNQDDLDIPAGADNVRSDALLQDGQAVAPGRLHAAHAQPRQAAVPRGDLSRTCASSS